MNAFGAHRIQWLATSATREKELPTWKQAALNTANITTFNRKLQNIVCAVRPCGQVSNAIALSPFFSIFLSPSLSACWRQFYSTFFLLTPPPHLRSTQLAVCIGREPAGARSGPHWQRNVPRECASERSNTQLAILPRSLLHIFKSSSVRACSHAAQI